jgi:hypothetical protein
MDARLRTSGMTVKMILLANHLKVFIGNHFAVVVIPLFLKGVDAERTGYFVV